MHFREDAFRAFWAESRRVFRADSTSTRGEALEHGGVWNNAPKEGEFRNRFAYLYSVGGSAICTVFVPWNVARGKLGCEAAHVFKAWSGPRPWRSARIRPCCLAARSSSPRAGGTRGGLVRRDLLKTITN